MDLGTYPSVSDNFFIKTKRFCGCATLANFVILHFFTFFPSNCAGAPNKKKNLSYDREGPNAHNKGYLVAKFGLDRGGV